MCTNNLFIVLCVVVFTTSLGLPGAHSQTSRQFVDRPQERYAGKKSSSPNKNYRIPFGSSGNTIRLEVANSSNQSITKLNIEVKDVPKWMTFTSPSVIIGDLKGGKKATAYFSFEVDKEAPVQKKVTLRFVAKNKDSYSWEKEISLSVEAPTELKLNQNYPNPFNPTTTIAYRLPQRMQVRVTVFNVLGQRVATLADESQAAGQQQLRWDASRYASGLYFYRIVADAPGGNKIIRNKKMMLVK